jgi:hypothetical protein
MKMFFKIYRKVWKLSKQNNLKDTFLKLKIGKILKKIKKNKLLKNIINSFKRKENNGFITYLQKKIKLDIIFNLILIIIVLTIFLPIFNYIL